mgnify:FL=1|jgi:hypothetical protein
MKDTNVKLVAHYRAKLDDLVEVRTNKHHPFKTKQSIVEQLIEAAHKKEVK